MSPRTPWYLCLCTGKWSRWTNPSRCSWDVETKTIVDRQLDKYEFSRCQRRCCSRQFHTVVSAMNSTEWIHCVAGLLRHSSCASCGAHRALSPSLSLLIWQHGVSCVCVTVTVRTLEHCNIIWTAAEAERPVWPKSAKVWEHFEIHCLPGCCWCSTRCPTWQAPIVHWTYVRSLMTVVKRLVREFECASVSTVHHIRM